MTRTERMTVGRIGKITVRSRERRLAPVLCRPPSRERGEAGYEEMQPREGDLESMMTRMRRGGVTMLTDSFLRSALSWPGNLRQVVTPDMVRETRWFRSP